MSWNGDMIPPDQLILDYKLAFFFFRQIQWTGEDVDAVVVLEFIKSGVWNGFYFGQWSGVNFQRFPEFSVESRMLWTDVREEKRLLKDVWTFSMIRSSSQMSPVEARASVVQIFRAEISMNFFITLKKTVIVNKTWKITLKSQSFRSASPSRSFLVIFSYTHFGLRILSSKEST